MIISDRHSKASGGCTFSLAGKLENEQEMENEELGEIRRQSGFYRDFIETVIKRNGTLHKLEMRHVSLTDDMLSGKTPWPTLKADYFVVVSSPLTLAPSRVQPHRQNIQHILATLQRNHGATPRMLLSSVNDDYEAEAKTGATELVEIREMTITVAEGKAWAKKYGAAEYRDVNTHGWVYDDPDCTIRTFYYDIHRMAYEAVRLSASQETAKQAPSQSAQQPASPPKPTTPARLVSHSSPVTRATPSSSGASSSSNGRHSPPQREPSPPKKKSKWKFWKKSPPKNIAPVHSRGDRRTLHIEVK